HRGPPPRAGVLVAGLAVSSAGNLLTGLAWAVAAAFAVQAVRGLGIAAMDVASTNLGQGGGAPGLNGGRGGRRRRPLIPAGGGAAGPDDDAGRLRGRRARRPAGPRRPGPGPAAGR